MDEFRFLVVELQTAPDGTLASLTTVYDDKAQAESKYHTILAAAALSQLPIHAAVILDNRGSLVECGEFIKPEYWPPKEEE